MSVTVESIQVQLLSLKTYVFQCVLNEDLTSINTIIIYKQAKSQRNSLPRLHNK